MSTKNEEASPADKAKQDAMYEEQEPKKIIRIITVTAYMISVSFVGIALSGYYIFLWHPPNPRLMHSQAPMHERLVHEDGAREAGLARMVGQPESFDLLAAAQQPDAHGSKARRQIVNNANVILRADFEKSEEATAPPLSALPSLNHFIVTNSTVLPVNISDSTSPNSEPLLSISSTDENEQRKSTSAASEESNVSAIPVSTLVLPTRRSKSFGKKHHQTPFALKHLEVPIKSDGQRKRPVRILTTTPSSTAGRSVIPSYAEEDKRDTAAAVAAVAASYKRDLCHVRMQLPRKMSAHITATIGRLGNRHSESKPAGNEVKLAGEESKDRLYEPKHKLKLVRVLTVVAYIISVSLAAIVLSLYYMYLWDPSSRLLAKRINTTNSSQPAGPKIACLELTPQADSDPLQDFSADSSTAGLADVAGPPASPQRTKNLFEMLTSRPGLRELDYATDVPMEPSADGFQPDYRDSTTELPEDLLDD